MSDITFEKFIDLINAYNKDEVPKITKAYLLANELHKGQKRESGEDYIIHPLNVAYILAQMHVDSDTVCAGLLHDTLEDTNITKEEIENLFNKDIANLVDGVTKISRINFISKEEMNYANTRKIITSIKDDIRIIIIKLADRLHNMRTLQYKKPEKQRENALETQEIFVPIANAIGSYLIRRELEDLSFMYLEPNKYYEVKSKKESIELENKELLLRVLQKVKSILEDKNIPNEIKIRTKNVYGVYQYIKTGKDIASLHDLLALKIMVDTIDNCYITLGACHSLYSPVNERFKDYIPRPKTTGYRAIHTTTFAEDKLVQFRIRTYELDKIGSYGLTAYYDTSRGEARKLMQEDLSHNFKFYESLSNIDDMYLDNKDFVTQVKNELFSEKVYIYTSNGEVIELPIGANVIDFAYYLNPCTANKMVEAYVNGEKVPFDYVLKNKDIVNIVTNDLVLVPDSSWELKAQTGYAKQMVKRYSYKKTSN